MDSLSNWAAEVFYRRLMSIVDDYGRFDGRASVIRAAAYPLKLNTVGDPDIGKWLDESESAGLVRKYTVNGKPYVLLLNFNQQIRAKSSLYPDPPAIQEAAKSENGVHDKHTHSTCIAHDHLVGVGVGVGDGGMVGAAHARTPPSSASQNGKLKANERISRERELERVQTALKQLRGKYNEGSKWKEPDVQRLKKLKTKEVEIMEILGVIV